MTKIKRSWDIISQEKRRESINGIIDFFLTERDEEIGVVAAGNLLDHFLQNIGLDLYNKGVEDSKIFLLSRFEDIGLDMDALLKKQV